VSTKSQSQIDLTSRNLTNAETGAITVKGVEMAFQSDNSAFKFLKRLDWETPGRYPTLNGSVWSGKTTLLSILAGLLMPDTGKVFYLEKKLQACLELS